MVKSLLPGRAWILPKFVAMDLFCIRDFLYAVCPHRSVMLGHSHHELIFVDCQAKVG